MTNKRTTAIVLAAGSGKRMNKPVRKQFLMLRSRPVLSYALKAFSDSKVIDSIIVVTSKEDMDYVRQEIIDKYGILKVDAVIEGGKERYDSVYNGLQAAKGCDYVLIHDGARPFVTEDIIMRTLEGAVAYESCVAGMPVKDTIRLADEEDFSKETPERKSVWQIQTPQAFSYSLARESFDKCIEHAEKLHITDDAMVVEIATGKRAKLVEGSYTNLKITTPEDLVVAEAICSFNE